MFLIMIYIDSINGNHGWADLFRNYILSGFMNGKSNSDSAFYALRSFSYKKKDWVVRFATAFLFGAISMSFKALNGCSDRSVEPNSVTELESVHICEQVNLIISLTISGLFFIATDSPTKKQLNKARDGFLNSLGKMFGITINKDINIEENFKNFEGLLIKKILTNDRNPIFKYSDEKIKSIIKTLYNSRIDDKQLAGFMGRILNLNYTHPGVDEMEECALRDRMEEVLNKEMYIINAIDSDKNRELINDRFKNYAIVNSKKEFAIRIGLLACAMYALGETALLAELFHFVNPNLKYSAEYLLMGSITSLFCAYFGFKWLAELDSEKKDIGIGILMQKIESPSFTAPQFGSF